MTNLLSRSSLRHSSLRNRLVVGVVFLAAMGFLVSDFTAQSALRSFLVRQVDVQLQGVVEGNFERLANAGIVNDEELNPLHKESGENSNDEARTTATPKQMSPVRRVPTATSLTLLGPTGEIIGQIGGDVDANQISQFIKDITPSDVTRNLGRPFTLREKGANFRVIARTLPNNTGTVVVAQSMDSVERTLHRMELLFLVIGFFALLLIGFASRTVIKIGLKPLEDVEDTAEQIAAGDLSARMPDAKPNTEVGRLVTSLNTMLGRIETSFTARVESESKLRRFVDDASHELRTPLTAIRGFAELHRQGAVQGEEKTAEVMRRIESESIRMGALVEDLLLLARMDQSREMKLEPIDLNELIEDVVASARAAGPKHPITISTPDDEVFILGDNDRVHQVIANLLANARTHTPVGTHINVELSHNEEGTTISVRDNGPGLRESDQKRIFERFYRADLSRQRTGSEGSGLGLSIVDAVMRAHGGSVEVSSKEGDGSTFTLFFPTAII